SIPTQAATPHAPSTSSPRKVSRDHAVPHPRQLSGGQRLLHVGLASSSAAAPGRRAETPAADRPDGRPRPTRPPSAELGWASCGPSWRILTEESRETEGFAERPLRR